MPPMRSGSASRRARRALSPPTMIDRAFRDHRFDLLVEGGKLVALIETVPEDAELFDRQCRGRPRPAARGLGIRLLRHAEDVALRRPSGNAALYQQADGGEYRALRAPRLYVQERSGSWRRDSRGPHGPPLHAMTREAATGVMHWPVSADPADLVGDVRALVGAATPIDEALLDAALRAGRLIPAARSART